MIGLLGRDDHRLRKFGSGDWPPSRQHACRGGNPPHPQDIMNFKNGTMEKSEKGEKIGKVYFLCVFNGLRAETRSTSPVGVQEQGDLRSRARRGREIAPQRGQSLMGSKSTISIIQCGVTLGRAFAPADSGRPKGRALRHPRCHNARWGDSATTSHMNPSRSRGVSRTLPRNQNVNLSAACSSRGGSALTTWPKAVLLMSPLTTAGPKNCA